MKKFFTVFSLLLITSAILLLTSCGGDDPASESAEKKQLEKLVGTWNLESAALGSDITWSDDFDGLTMALSGEFEEGGTYDYTMDIDDWPINSPWPENGEWKFGGTSGADLTSEFVRLDDNQVMTYSVTDDELTFTFTYNGDGFQNSKVSSVEGNWVFVFTK